MQFANHVNKRVTAQTDQASPLQVKNNAGGYTFQVDEWKRLERFLILGTEGGSYYATEKKMTKDNAKCIDKCLALDPARTIKTIVEVSDGGRAPKNDYAIFALAMAAGSENPEARKLALAALPSVCRIGTHLFQFVSVIENFRGWGRGLRTAVGNWYLNKNADQLAFQVLKYQQRGGWSHRDVLRLAHLTPTPEQNAVLRWAVSGYEGLGDRSVVGKDKVTTRTYNAVDNLPAILSGYEELKKATSVKDVVNLIQTYGFTHEMIPNEHKASKEVWEALLPKMGYTALVRNLGKLTSVGLLTPMSNPVNLVTEKLNDFGAIKKARVHPINILIALLTYAQGHGDKGKLTWTPNQRVVDALNEAFYGSFQTVEPTGKNHLIAVDVSGSMSWTSWGANSAAGCQALSPRLVASAMAMTVARSEKNYHLVGFSHRMQELKISPTMRLDEVVRIMEAVPMGRTDCGLPMIYAKETKLPVDAFSVFTDNETYAGNIHPHQALRQFRETSGRAAKLAVFGVTATEFTIADPNDAGQMDFVGFDSAAPSVFADFVRN
jgi:60 kDa SS-A/Ro ribonucleoprotein